MTIVSEDATLARIDRTLGAARARLLDERTSAGHWVGELSTSALSTATATLALALVARARARQTPGFDGLDELVREGQAWLAAHANADGGFGDTVDSPSNLSTTALAWTALGRAGLGLEGEDGPVRGAAAEWLRERIGALEPERLAAALEAIYGKDRTFAIPILAACAMGRAFGADTDAWGPVRALPFELAALPQSLFRWVGLPVVSYALPALIAIGQAIEHHRPTRNPLTRAARGATRQSTLRVLDRIQPTGGGFLEAAPLTSFVLMSLASIGHADHPVAERAVGFLRDSVRPDGSWPIDTNLATWVTTLAVNGLQADLPQAERDAIRDWLLGQQLKTVHPYTGAAPGGWAWTDLPGGVPDADDTPGALLALRALDERASLEAAVAGTSWLADLQNRDGGMPTFCRGWGKLPFDQSCADLAAHAMRAWTAWMDDVPPALATRLARARTRAAGFLARAQRSDGSWVPLWFGNQAEPAQENPLYGTSRVLLAAGGPPVGADERLAWTRALERGFDWLLAAQHAVASRSNGAGHAAGGFGGAEDLAPTVEETALGLEALCAGVQVGTRAGELRPRIQAAAGWLAQATREGTRFEPRPIGLYFAKLWYSERLYPLVFTVSALTRARAILTVPVS